MVDFIAALDFIDNPGELLTGHRGHELDPIID
jgi:hypothetical protein